MKRIDKITKMTAEELGHYLCNKMDESRSDDICHTCPWTNMCDTYHNGIVAWLNEEVEDKA